MVHVGIDLGTSNTVVSYFDNGEVVSHRIDDAVLVPSVIYVEQHAGRTTVGQAAVDEWADPQFSATSSFRRWKLDMGDDKVLGELALGGGKRKTQITPERLTTWLVEYVVGQIADGVGGREVESVVVTVPHGWRRESPERCAATRAAASAAVVAGGNLRVRELTLSEPVAAASYWLWEARRHRDRLADEFVGKTILVVDIGGGTFDLSLVRVGSPDSPLVVIDAINNDIAGDYATALILGRATALSNEELDTELPTEASQLMAFLADGEAAWVRSWFLGAQDFVRKMSLRIGKAASSGRPVVPLSQSFDLPDGDVTLRLSQADFLEALEPFYAASRGLVRHFLSLQKPADMPHGVVFAGGGSRIAGVMDQAVLPAFVGIVPDPQTLVTRIALNDSRVDQAVSLGAALVAAGEVTVEERLLYDVGLEITVPAQVSRQLGIGETAAKVVVSPILARASKLPASGDSKSVIGDMSIAPGSSYDFKVVIFDDPIEPFIQEWSRPHLGADGSRVSVSVELSADTDGRLTARVDAKNGAGDTMTGVTSPLRDGRASLMMDVVDGSAARFHVVAPEDLRKAAAAVRSGK